MKKNLTFCPLPWLHLATHPSGHVTLCCEADSSKDGLARNFRTDDADEVLSLNTHSVSEHINSDFFKQVRLQMLRGEVPSACANCFQKESQGAISKRLYEMQRYPDLTIDQASTYTRNDGSITPKLEFIELRLGNICNVKCRTCGAYSSSKWITEHHKLLQKFDFVPGYDKDLDSTWTLKDEFWQELAEVAPNPKLYYINGGEPMLNHKHWILLEYLIESGSSKYLKLDYSCNMTAFPEKIFEYWKHFKEVEIRASIDDLNERNYYIRYPTTWTKVMDSLHVLRKNKIKFNIVQTVSVLNFFYLDDFLEWANSENINFGHNFVRDPLYLRPDAIPLQARKKILARLSERLPNKLFKPLLQLWGHSNYPERWQQFILFTQELDRSRKQQFRTVFPEFCSFLESESIQLPD